MGFFGKKKKEDDLGFDLGSKPGSNMGLPPFDPSDPLGSKGAPPPSGGYPDPFNDKGMMDHSAQDPFATPGAISDHNQEMQMPNQGFSQQNLNENLKSQMETIIAKIDSVKAQLELMNQRIMKIERIADEESKTEQKRVW